MRSFVACSLLLILVASTVRAAEDPLTVKSLDNTDIKWDAFFLGIFPRMSDRSKKVLNEVTAKDVDALLTMLEDKNRFVIAHVILAEIHAIEAEIHADQFFGLKVDLYGDGRVVYPNYKPETLSRYWQKVHKEAKLDLPSARRVDENE
jgi:hypothetical protein